MALFETPSGALPKNCFSATARDVAVNSSRAAIMAAAVVLLPTLAAAWVPSCATLGATCNPQRGSRVVLQSEGRALRLAEQDDLMQVARLQLDAFDPVEEMPEEKPSMFASLFGGGGGGSRASREQRQERLAIEIAERVEKGSDIWVVEEAAGVSPVGTELS